MAEEKQVEKLERAECAEALRVIYAAQKEAGKHPPDRLLEAADLLSQPPNRLSRDDGELREAIEAEIHKLRAIEPSNEAGPMTKQLARATADRLQAALVEGDPSDA